MSAKIKFDDSTEIKENKEISGSQINIVFNEIKLLTTVAKEICLKLNNLQSTANRLKLEIQDVLSKIEQNIDGFSDNLTANTTKVLNLLSDEQSHIHCTIDNCYKTVDNLVKVFLHMGYELEKDITGVSIKVNEVDSEMRKIDKTINKLKSLTDENGIVWYINSEGRLAKMQCFVFGSILPQFKCGDKNMRQDFLRCLSNSFSNFQVPRTHWVNLTADQFIGITNEWWRLVKKKEMTWEQFSSAFIEFSMNDLEKNNSESIDVPNETNTNNLEMRKRDQKFTLSDCSTFKKNKLHYDKNLVYPHTGMTPNMKTIPNEMHHGDSSSDGDTELISIPVHKGGEYYRMSCFKLTSDSSSVLKESVLSNNRSVSDDEKNSKIVLDEYASSTNNEPTHELFDY